MASLGGDPDLDDILDSALADFDKPDEELTKPPILEPILGEWTEEEEARYVKDLSDKFDETLSKLLAKDPNMKQRDDESGPGELELDENTDPNFDSNLAETMEKLLKREKERMTSSSSADDPPDDVIPKDPQAFMGVLESLLGTLLSKDVLYEPLRELRDLYPEWLRENTSHEHYEGYVTQRDIVTEICGIFEEPDHNKHSEQVYELLCRMQDTGPPPAQIMAQMTQDMPESLRMPPTSDDQQCVIS